MDIPRTRPPRERLTLIVALALLLFVTPVVFSWARDDSPWYLIYLLRLLIIVLSAWHSRSRRSDDV